MKRFSLLVLVFLFTFITYTLFAQTGTTSNTKISSEEEKKTVPTEFAGISLGMSMEEVQEKLKGNGLFWYRGEADVSLLPRPNESLIEVAGLSYIKRAFFQFYNGKLFIMIFVMNEKMIDHYTIFTNFQNKYGKFTSFTPSEIVWQDDATRVSIERPLAVKYIDLKVYNELVVQGQQLESYEKMLLDDFLNQF